MEAMPEIERVCLVARLTKDIMLENPCLTPGSLGSGQQNLGISLSDRPSFCNTPRKPVCKSTLTTTMGRGKKRRVVEDESEEEVEVAKSSKGMLPMSKRLPRADWPSGYTSDDVDCFTITDLLMLRQAQDKAERKSKEGLPGVVNKRIESAKKLCKVPAGVDNGHDKLHEARFFRPTGALPKDWWSSVPEAWSEKRGEQWSAVLGTTGMIPSRTFAALHNRAISLRMRHFMEKNVAVIIVNHVLCTINNNWITLRLSCGRQSSRYGDDASVEGWKKNYVGPNNLTEVNNGLDNLQAALLQLWPWDYTAQVWILFWLVWAGM